MLSSNRNILVKLFCLIAILSYSQDWSETKNIDTLRSKNGQILRIENNDNGEEIEFEYDITNKLSKTAFTIKKKGIQYEKVTEYHSSGNIAKKYFRYILDKKIYGKPQLDSSYSEYFENGKIKAQTFYSKGKKKGPAKLYYQNGQIESEMNYLDDKLISIQCFDMNGNSLYTGDFKDGNGKLVIYKEGIQISVCRYKNGKMLQRTCKCN